VKGSTRLIVALATVVLVNALVAGVGVSDRRNTATPTGLAALPSSPAPTRNTAILTGLAALPSSPAPALRIQLPERLKPRLFMARWTIVRRATPARARPEAGAPEITMLATESSEGTPNALQVLRSRPDTAGRLWVQVRLPGLPNGRVGWVERRMLGGYQTVDTHLLVDRALLRASLYRSGKVVFTAPVGIGTDSWPTPAGDFMIRDELTRYKSAFYGPVAFGTTARSSVLTDWPGGGFIGLHGTDRPGLIPGRISHGCIRMRNGDITRLATLMPVGTPLTIK
jgi:L,D-transpeptidase catalytic domain